MTKRRAGFATGSSYDIMGTPYIIGEFHSIVLHKIKLGGQLYTYYHFVPRGSKQISSNFIYVLPNTRSIPTIDN